MKNAMWAAALVAAVTVPAAVAAEVSGVQLSQDHRMTFTTHAMPSQGVRQVEHAPSGLKPLVDLVGYDYPKGRYISNFGWTVSGPTSLIGEQSWLAVAYTAKRNGMLNEVDVGVGYVLGGMGVVISVAADAGGVPGDTLATYKVKKMFTFGACCALERVFDATGVPMLAGSTYWVTVTTDSATADEWGAWTMTDVDQVDPATAAVNTGSGWVPTLLQPAPSIALFGM